jgi:hypothetical protein
MKKDGIFGRDKGILPSGSVAMLRALPMRLKPVADETKEKCQA